MINHYQTFLSIIHCNDTLEKITEQMSKQTVITTLIENERVKSVFSGK